MRRRLLGGFLLFAMIVMVLLEVPLGLSLASDARTTSMSGLQNDSASLAVLVGASFGRRDTIGASDVITRFAGAENAIVASALRLRLGLAIVTPLTRVSGGTAWLNAAKGGGLEAVVRLEAS